MGEWVLWIGIKELLHRIRMYMSNKNGHIRFNIKWERKKNWNENVDMRNGLQWSTRVTATCHQPHKLNTLSHMQHTHRWHAYIVEFPFWGDERADTVHSCRYRDNNVARTGTHYVSSQRTFREYASTARIGVCVQCAPTINAKSFFQLRKAEKWKWQRKSLASSASELRSQCSSFSRYRDWERFARATMRKSLTYGGIQLNATIAWLLYHALHSVSMNSMWHPQIHSYMYDIDTTWQAGIQCEHFVLILFHVLTRVCVCWPVDQSANNTV